MTTLAIAKPAKSVSSEKQHPLKNRAFFGIPRQVALMPGVTDRIFRILSVLFSAFGEDGHIEFKIRTLALLLQKSERQTRDLIKEIREKGFVTTQETGRSLLFFLTEKCFEDVRKPADQVGGNPPISYKDQKNSIKEKKQSNPPPLSGADLVTSLLTVEQRKTIDRVLVNSIGKYIPCDQIPALIANAFQTDFPINYLWGAIRKARQSLTRPPSPTAPPAKPQKQPADQNDILSEREKHFEEQLKIAEKIDQYVANLTDCGRIELIMEMRDNFTKFQKKRSKIFYFDAEDRQEQDELFKNRTVRLYIENQKLHTT